MEDIRKCEKCGAEIDINDQFCPECGAKQPLRFHYDAYETSVADMMITSGTNVSKSERLKSISLEDNVLTVSSLKGQTLAGTVDSFDSVVVGNQWQQDSKILKFSKDGKTLTVFADGADLYPQDWEHIIMALKASGAIEKTTFYANKWQWIIPITITVIVLLIILAAFCGIIDI